MLAVGHWGLLFCHIYAPLSLGYEPHCQFKSEPLALIPALPLPSLVGIFAFNAPFVLSGSSPEATQHSTNY